MKSIITIRNRGWPLYSIFFFLINPGLGTCPDYCTCGYREGLMEVQCVDQGIIGLDLDLPMSVEWLQLGNNSISVLYDGVFQYFGLKRIVVLNLEYNSIRTIGLFAFKGLKQLQLVDLSRNYIRSILPGIFEDNPSLKSLSLKGNPLKILPESNPFLSSKSMQALDISGCRLGHIPWQSFALLPKLINLNITNNELLTIDKNALDILSNLQLIDITQNRLICDSHISELSSWLATKKIKFQGSPCKDKHMSEKITKTTEAKPVEKKFEKMVISIAKDHDEEDDLHYNDYYSGESDDQNCNCNLEKTAICPTQLVPECRGRFNLPLMFSLAMLGGFVVGLLFTAIVGLLRTYVPRRRGRFRTRRNFYEIPLGTPPPPYNELIFTFQQLNNRINN